jgi:hypothetical protein
VTGASDRALVRAIAELFDAVGLERRQSECKMDKTGDVQAVWQRLQCKRAFWFDLRRLLDQLSAPNAHVDFDRAHASNIRVRVLRAAIACATLFADRAASLHVLRLPLSSQALLKGPFGKWTHRMKGSIDAFVEAVRRQLTHWAQARRCAVHWQPSEPSAVEPDELDAKEAGAIRERLSRFHSPVAQGTGGVVYLMDYRERKVAVKLIPMADAEEQRAVQREVAALRKLKGVEHVVNFIGAHTAFPQGMVLTAYAPSTCVRARAAAAVGESRSSLGLSDCHLCACRRHAGGTPVSRSFDAGSLGCAHATALAFGHCDGSAEHARARRRPSRRQTGKYPV